MLGAIVPTGHGQWRHITQMAEVIEDAGWDYLFCNEVPGSDSISAAFLATSVTKRLYVGTSIANIYLRHPFLMSNLASILQELSFRRFILGLGVSHPYFNEPVGVSTGHPVSEMLEYVSQIDKYTGGRENVPIWLAALRKPMSVLAGQIGDGALFNLVPLSYLPKAVANVREGQSENIKTKDTMIATYIRIGVTKDEKRAREAARKMLGFYCRLPAYQDLFTKAGYEDEMESFRLSVQSNDHEAAKRALTDQLIADIAVFGTPLQCKEILSRYKQAGADALLFAPLPIEGDELPALFKPVLDVFRLT